MSRLLLQTAPPPSPPLSNISLSTNSGPVVLASENDRVSVALSSPLSRAEPTARPLIRLQQLRFDASQPLVLHVFINQPDATVDTPRSGNPNYVTSLFSILVHI
ncbi:hypothetical protein CBR_g24425 [Chara braunii]|uniref:Uncharacterized protein n=1 Tax=Chara braunii TaxID=69332 RepID=A0A388JN02_CHABU|nr:hypothetical protein CBR_g24425 [Chara braunii]|eukprot:GBG59082.1 hypothetical protein CBR_g24425 [Chara braunii]